MVFDWFFGSKKNKEIFAEFLAELKKLALIDDVFEKLVEEKPLDEEKARVEINQTVRKLEKLFLSFTKLLEDQKSVLQLYIVTSVEGYDYLSEIEKLAEKLAGIFKKMDAEFHRDDLWKFVEESSDLRIEIHELVNELRAKMELFYGQSKKSLEWNYQGGAKNVGLIDFKKGVHKLGGVIDTSKGTHLEIIYKLFQHIVSVSQKKKTEIAGGTFRGQIDRSFSLQVIGNAKKEALIRAKGITAEKLRDYLKAYFLIGDDFFCELFVTKYKDLFKVK